MSAAKATDITDDQELAKVLESMNQQAAASVPEVPAVEDVTAPDVTTSPSPTDSTSSTTSSGGLSFEETPDSSEVAADATTPTSVSTDTSSDTFGDTVVTSSDETSDTPSFGTTPASSDVSTSPSSDLDGIKKSALEELRPLVDKLSLPADEKFDTLLLLIRSTDDKSLISAAHDAAKNIEDETKRAQALLDVIKEIDYFSAQK